MDAKVILPPREMQPANDIVPDALIAAFEDANTAVAVFDHTGKTVYTNSEMKTLAAAFGYAIATLLDLAPDDRTNAAYIDFERFRAGRIDSVRTRYKIHCADDTAFWADLSIRRHVFTPGRSPLTIAQIVDITAEHEARRNELRLETALEAGRQGVWDYDARTGLATYSRMWRRLRGMSDEAFCDGLTETWLSRVHPDDRDNILSAATKQGIGEDGFDTIEYRERHKDGHYVWIMSRGRPIEWDEDGNSLRMIGTDTDITRFKAVEAELAVEKERLHVTLQSIADGVISTDRDGLITFINEAAERMTGWTVEDALGQEIEAVFDSRLEDKPDVAVGLMAQCLDQGRVHQTVNYTLLKSKTGSSRYIRELASPILGEDGAVIGAVMVFRDATKRRELIRELEHTATHDPLTDLGNRVSFERRLEESLLDANEGKGHHALCLIDLDHFKRVNDRAGHSAGDAVLKKIATLIRESCRQSDCVARIGGDEFGIILNNCTIKVARKIAQTIVRRVAALRFEWQDETFPIGTSIGIAAIDGTTTNATELYRNADTACYAAKRNGRGCITVSDGPIRKPR